MSFHSQGQLLVRGEVEDEVKQAERSLPQPVETFSTDHLMEPLKNDGRNVVTKRSNRSRLLRNDMERARRIRYNNRIMELAMIVPTIATARKRLDKTSILRLTVNFLRLYKELQMVQSSGPSWTNDLLNHQISSLLLESLGGFLLVVDTTGSIVFVSSDISKYLGLQKVDLLGHDVGHLVHPDDCDTFMKLLKTTPGITQAESRSAYLRMRALKKGQTDTYQTVQLHGRLKMSTEPVPPHEVNDTPGGVLVAVVKRVAEELSLEVTPQMDMPSNQFMGYVCLDGTLILNDPRGALMTGFTSAEIRGQTVYDSIIYGEDIPYAINAHKQLIQSNGSIVPWTLLRFKCKNGSLLYMYITSHMVLDPWTKKPRYLISVNHNIGKASGDILLEQQRRRFQNIELIYNAPSPVDIDNWVLSPKDGQVSPHNAELSLDQNHGSFMEQPSSTTLLTPNSTNSLDVESPRLLSDIETGKQQSAAISHEPQEISTMPWMDHLLQPLNTGSGHYQDLNTPPRDSSAATCLLSNEVTMSALVLPSGDDIGEHYSRVNASNVQDPHPQNEPVFSSHEEDSCSSLSDYLGTVDFNQDMNGANPVNASRPILLSILTGEKI